MKVSDFKSEDELKKMKVADIKKHVREFNDHYKISGYSKATKSQLIGQVLTAQKRIRNAGGSKPAPAPKPATPAKKAPKKQEKLTAKEIRDQQKIPYSVVLKRKDSDGIPYINVWDSFLMRAIKLQKDEKYPEYQDDEARRIIRKTEREVKSRFRKGLPEGLELTPKEWRKKMMDFMDKQEKSIKAELKRKGLE